MAKKDLTPDDIDPAFIISSFKTNGKPSAPAPVSKPTEQEMVSAEQPTGKAETSPKVETPKPEISKPETDATSRKRKNKTEDYTTLFVQETNLTARLGKTVYIRKEYHERMLKIIQVIGENEVSLFSYLDNILTQHFQTYQDEITEIYKQKEKGLF